MGPTPRACRSPDPAWLLYRGVELTTDSSTDVRLLPSIRTDVPEGLPHQSPTKGNQDGTMTLRNQDGHNLFSRFRRSTCVGRGGLEPTTEGL
jgi:hypothetical protein